jgi:hypothetical protein
LYQDIVMHRASREILCLVLVILAFSVTRGGTPPGSGGSLSAAEPAEATKLTVAAAQLPVTAKYAPVRSEEGGGRRRGSGKNSQRPRSGVLRPNGHWAAKAANQGEQLVVCTITST